ncbi:MAG: sigma-54-dependent Fis family transcriptional regulator [Planctomycetes bacterium]|nr:sigma-54-dependent Fis family transcriptional regulator [Planctomycetota bacterium]
MPGEVSPNPRAAGKGSLLVVDDEKLVRVTLTKALGEAGFDVAAAPNAAEALSLCEQASYDIVLLDYVLPDASGLELLPKVRALQPEAAAIMITSHSSVENAVASMKGGASDYIAKPFSTEDILLRLEKVLETRRLQSELRLLREEQVKKFGVARIVGQSPAMQKVFALVERVVETPDATILIRGESGTGKDILAKAIHYGGPRAAGPDTNVTCTALQDTLLESELFGHEKGAFTDAKTMKKGLVEVADGGTLFLDEIGDMSLALQGKLLRFLEEKAFRRVGGQKDLHVRVRIVAATNRDLEDAVAKGTLREDLYFRLNVIPVHLPPLRERTGDIPLLVDHFMDEYNRELRKDVRRVDPKLMKELAEHHWPGNVRELKNTIERAMILCRGESLTSEDVLGHLRRDASRGSGAFRLPPEGLNLAEVEKDLLLQALEATGGNLPKAGRLLGLNKDQVRYRLLKYGVRSNVT